MRATLKLRGHIAVMDIPYDEQRFSIRYVDSTNLNYDGTNIHPNFNFWVRNLELDIERQSVTDSAQAAEPRSGAGSPKQVGIVNVNQ